MSIHDILAYSPPYGPNYLKDISTIGFMADCGIQLMKLIICNSSSRLGFSYSPYSPIWQSEYSYDFTVIRRRVSCVTELFSGQRIAINTDEFTVFCEAPDTRLYLLEA